MFELTLAKAANRLYRGVVRLSLNSVNLRDKVNLKVLNRRLSKAEQKHETAEDLVEAASRLHNQADEDADKCHAQYGAKLRQINSAYHTLENALDDSAFA